MQENNFVTLEKGQFVEENKINGKLNAPSRKSSLPKTKKAFSWSKYKVFGGSNLWLSTDRPKKLLVSTFEKELFGHRIF